MIIKIPMGEWMITSGLVGLQRVFEFGLKEGYIDSSMRGHIKPCYDGLEMNTEVLPFIPESYLRYMLNEYNVYEREMTKIKNALKYAITEKAFKNALSTVKKVVSDKVDKISKNFPDVAGELEEIKSRIKKIKKMEQLAELEVCVKQFEKILKREDINEKLTSNYFKATVLNMFFGQASFLNTDKSKLDFQEMVELFEKDYIIPVIQDLTLQEMIQIGASKKEILAYIEENKTTRKAFNEVKKLLKKKEPQEIMKCINTCLFFDEFLAFENYEEKVFSPLMVSNKNALNFSWNLNKKQPMPISSLAKLILFLAPAGVAVYYKKEGFENIGDIKQYVGFVQMESSFLEILEKNDSFKNLKKNKSPFDRIASKLVQGLKKESEFLLRHMFFLEFTSEYQTKKTRLQYYHLPDYLARFFIDYAKDLDRIHPYDFREQFVQYLLRGADPVSMIFKYIRYLINENLDGYGALMMVLLRHRIRHLKKGEKEAMDEKDKKVYVLYKIGQEVRRSIENEISSRKEHTDSYVASAQKKVNGIAYRLLNLVNSGDRHEFFNAFCRLHMSYGKEVPILILEIFKEKDLDFKTIGNAFISGLLSSGQPFKKEKTTNTEEEK
jgi:CRISPR-associated protein Cst1